MRKTLTAILLSSACSFTLLGCGEKPADFESGQKLDAVIADFEALRHTDLPFEGNTFALTYMEQIEVPGASDSRTQIKVPVRGSYSDSAVLSDQRRALIPRVEELLTSPNDTHKKIAHRMLATIYADEAMHLIAQTYIDAQRANVEILQIDKTAREAISLTGVKQQELETLDTLITATRTGRLNDKAISFGLSDYQAKVEDAKNARIEAQKKLDEITAKIQAQQDIVDKASREALQLRSKSQSTLDAKDRYILDTKAIDAESRKELARATIDFYIAKPDTSDGDAFSVLEIAQKNVEAEKELESRLTAEINRTQDRLAELEKQKEAVRDQLDALIEQRSPLAVQMKEDFERVDAQMMAAGFERMNRALELIKKSKEHLEQAGSDQETTTAKLAGLYVLKARLVLQYELAATYYLHHLKRIHGYGQAVLGGEFSRAIETRMGDVLAILGREDDLDAWKQEDLAGNSTALDFQNFSLGDTGPLKTALDELKKAEVSSLMQDMRRGADNATPDGQQSIQLVDEFNRMIERPYRPSSAE